MIQYRSIPFLGCCAMLGSLSEQIPDGVDHPIRISRKEMDKAIDSLFDKPINFNPGLDRHGSTGIVGCVRAAWTTNTEVLIGGVLWVGLLPELEQLADSDQLGFSLEFDAAGIHHKWVRNFNLNGVAIMLKKHAAYQNTWVRLDRNARPEYSSTVGGFSAEAKGAQRLLHDPGRRTVQRNARRVHSV